MATSTLAPGFFSPRAPLPELHARLVLTRLVLALPRGNCTFSFALTGVSARIDPYRLRLLMSMEICSSPLISPTVPDCHPGRRPGTGDAFPRDLVRPGSRRLMLFTAICDAPLRRHQQGGERVNDFETAA